jgi:hypothetical protein
MDEHNYLHAIIQLENNALELALYIFIFRFLRIVVTDFIIILHRKKNALFAKIKIFRGKNHKKCK